MARVLPAVQAPWLPVPAGEGRIGPGWPAVWAAARGATLRREPEGGLIPDLSRLEGADSLHPAVRAFYEHTARFSLALRARWWGGLSLPGRVWAALYARRWGQLELPLGRGASGLALTNEVYRSSGADPCQWWVRRYPDDRALYVSRYDLVDVCGEPAPCVRIAFPVPGGTWVVLFRAVLDDGALVLTEAGGRAGGPGAYLVPAGGPARYLRALREEIRVSANDAGCLAVHRLWWLGVPFLTLSYALEPSSRSTAK